MLTAYFDASGSADDYAFAVAGYIAPAEIWLAWERAWLERLSRDGLTHFHTTDFNSSQGEFAIGWKGNEDRRRQLIIDLTGIIRNARLTRKVGVVLETAHISENFSAIELHHWKLTPYLVAARSCAGQIRQWAKREEIEKWPELVFEDGDQHRGALEQRFREDVIPPPQFRPKKDRIDKHGCLIRAAVALQAADLLAYEMFDPTKKIARDGYIRRIKKTFDALQDGTPGELGIMKPEHWAMLRAGLQESEPLPAD